jgi:hypothetical protein
MSCSACLTGCPTCQPSPFPEICETCWHLEEGTCDGEPDADDSCPRIREAEAEAAQEAYDRRQEDAYWRAVEKGW